MNTLRSIIDSKVKRNLFMLGLFIIIAALLVTPVASKGDKPTPESVIQEYLSNTGTKIESGTPKYKILLQDILLGQHPDLVAAAGDQQMTAYAISQLGINPDLDTGKMPTIKITRNPLRKNNLPNDEARHQTYLSESAAIIESYNLPPKVNYEFNRSSAATYALNWSSTTGGKKRNSNYPDFTNDCTNFASQAMFAGGIPQQGSGTCRNEDTSSEWYVKKISPPWWCLGSMRDWTWSNAWSVVYPFRQYMTSSGHAGAYVIPRTTNSINQLIYDAWEGDIIQLRSNGTSYHTMIVTSWYYNSFTNSDLRMTYHTGPNGNDVREKSLKAIINSLPSTVEVIFVPVW